MNKVKSSILPFRSYREEVDDISVAGDADQAALKRRSCAQAQREGPAAVLSDEDADELRWPAQRRVEQWLVAVTIGEMQGCALTSELRLMCTLSEASYTGLAATRTQVKNEKTPQCIVVVLNRTAAKSAP